MLLNFRRSQLSDKNAYLHFVYEEYAKKKHKKRSFFWRKKGVPGWFWETVTTPKLAMG